MSSVNISKVASAKLCNTCGACFGLCPAEAIYFEETRGGYSLPVVDEDACTRCGCCLEVCPGVHFGDTLVSNMPEDPFAGPILESFVGKAADKRIFHNSQSGGIVSALLVHALKTGRIKGAVSVTMQSGFPPRPVVRIGENKQEILQAQKSKYCPVPLLGFLKDLKRHEGPVAVVGTSCQIHGLKNVMDKYTKLQERIAFTIGLVCDRVLTFSAMDYLVYKASSNANRKPRMLHFRDKLASGYPGDVHVIFDDGTSRIIPAAIRIQSKDYFTPARCRLCFDKMNVFSDLTVGDPHGVEGVDRTRGESMLIVRTTFGQKVVDEAMVEGAINIRPVANTHVLRGQKISLKKDQWHGYANAWKNFGRECPDFFELIKDNEYTSHNCERYKKNLEYSLGLDDFESREALVRFVHKSLRKKQIINMLLKPFRLTQHAVGKKFK